MALPTRYALWFALPLFAVVCVNRPVASAQSALESAESAYEAGQLDEASTQLQAALRTGALGPERVARVYRLIGVLAVADGRDADALSAFTVSLALNVEQSTPPELGPEQAAPFEAARAERERSPFALLVEHDTIVRNAPLPLRVQPSSPPADLIATYRVSAQSTGAPWTTDAAAANGSVTLEAMAWRGAERIEVEVSARDRFGNTLARQALTLSLPAEEVQPPEILLPPPVVEETPDPPSSRRTTRIVIGVIAGVVLAGAATGLGLWLARRPVPTTFEFE